MGKTKKHTKSKKHPKQIAPLYVLLEPLEEYLTDDGTYELPVLPKPQFLSDEQVAALGPLGVTPVKLRGKRCSYDTSNSPESAKRQMDTLRNQEAEVDSKKMNGLEAKGKPL